MSFAFIFPTLLIVAAVQPSGNECAQPCACTSSRTAAEAWKSHRAARRMAVSLEQGAVDSGSLEEAQQELSTAIALIRTFRDQCTNSAASCAGSTAAIRRSCSCRPHRLLNLTQAVSRRLDDAAAGVLFGDGEENMLKLSSAHRSHG